MIHTIDQQIELGKKRAQDLLSGKDLDEKSVELLMRFALSKRYNIPIFDEYFSKRTIEDLAFELELHMYDAKDKNVKTADLVKENKEEMEDFFDDMAEEDTVPPMSEEELKMYQEFMQTGDFIDNKGENK
jgi:hypothetical protein